MKSGLTSSRKASPFFFPLENIVVLVRTRACFQNSLFSPSARYLHPPPAAVAHQARAGFAVVRNLSISVGEKGTPFGVPFSLASVGGIDIKHSYSSSLFFAVFIVAIKILLISKQSDNIDFPISSVIYSDMIRSLSQYSVSAVSFNAICILDMKSFLL
jgi:hypothetical protein